MQYIGEIYSIDSDVGVQKIKQYRVVLNILIKEQNLYLFNEHLEE